MMGFNAAASEEIFVQIDPEEPQTILADFGDNEAEGVWLRAANAFNEATEQNELTDNSETMAYHALSDEQWDALSALQQADLHHQRLNNL